MDERAVDFDEVELRFAAANLRVGPDVAERAADAGRRHRIRERLNRLALPEIERADVVEAHEVIGVGVREEDEVEPWDRELQELQAKVGTRVDEEVLAGVLDLDGLAQSFVARVGRRADVARASDYGDAGGCSAAEESDAHKRFHAEVAQLHRNPFKRTGSWINRHRLPRLVPRRKHRDDRRTIQHQLLVKVSENDVREAGTRAAE